MGEYTSVKRRKVGGQGKRPKILKPLIGLSLLMAVLAVYTALRSNTGADSSDVDDSLVNQYGNLSELEDPDRFMQAYLDANGGLENLENLQTMRINGLLLQDENELKIFMLKRRPDMALITYRQGQSEVTHGHAEGRFWVRSYTPDKAPVYREMSEVESAQMRKSLPMFGPVLSAYLTQQGRIETIQTSVYKDKKLLEVNVVTGSDNPAKKVLVDPKTMTIVSEYSTSADGREIISEFFDYLSVDGVKIPHRILTRSAGSELSTFVVESISFNIGASSSLFRADDMD